MREILRNRAVEADGFGKDQSAVDAHAPAIRELALEHRFAHGGAAKDDGLGQQQRGALSKIDVDRAPQPDLIEDNCFLRQPGEPAALADFKLHSDLGIRRERAIDLLRRRRGHGQTGAGADFDRRCRTCRRPSCRRRC